MALFASPTRRRRRYGDRGLTLVEMVVAMGVVMVVLLAAGAAFFTIGAGQRSAESNDRAAQLAQDQIETIRKVPWEQLGLYAGDTGYRASCPPTSCKTTAAEPTVTLQGTRPAGSRAPLPMTNPPVSTYANAFTVRTDVTWDEDDLSGLPFSTRVANDDHWNNTVGDPTKTGQTSTPDGIPDYNAKRVTVTVTWTLGNATKTVTDSLVRAPGLNEAVPDSVGTATADACDSNAYPFCRLWVTNGAVLNAPGGSSVSSVVPVSFHAVTSKAVDTGQSVTASWTQTNGSTNTITLTTSDGGRTWDKTLAAGTTLPIGPVTVTFTAIVGGQTLTTAYTKTAWRSIGAGGASDRPADIVPLSLPLGATYTGQVSWLPADLVTDTTKPAGDTTPITGNESQSNPSAFCVDSSGNLKNFQAFIFDITNVDGQDVTNFKPTVTYTGTTLASQYGNNPAPADGSGPNSTVTGTVGAVAITSPSSTQTTPTNYLGSSGGGVVGSASSTAPGVLQRYRFAAGFARGTVLKGASTTLTVSLVRPFDGVTVQRSIPVPVSSTCTTPAPAQGRYVAAEMATNPMDVYRLNDASGTLAKDSAGSSNGAYNGDVTLNQPSTIGGDSTARSVAFGGVSGQIDLPTSPAGTFNSGYTAAAWVYPTANSTWARIVELGNGPGSGAGADNIMLSRYGSSTQIYYGLRASDGSLIQEIMTPSGALPLNTWTFVVVTVDNTGKPVIYVNGAAAATGTSSGAIPAVTRTQAYVGRSNYPADAYWAGQMSEIGIWNRALSASEVASLWAAR